MNREYEILDLLNNAITLGFLIRLEKIKHFEALLIKSKDAITLKNNQIQELQTKVESAKVSIMI